MMGFDRRFLLLCTGEVLVVAADNVVAALILQMVILAVFLGNLRGYLTFAVGVSLFAVLLAMSGTVYLPLLVLAAALGCGYLILAFRDYRLTRWAGGDT
ncbi:MULTISPECIES: hypothetical protein [Methanoculleus]|jgi:hypothetical protein|nr:MULTISPECIES: hypothetical protein [Methanoculleus]